MNIAIFGATGRTGLQVVDRALRRGHDVTVFVRNPNKLGENQARVKVIQGDIQDKSLVSQAITGTQAVISVLGPTVNQPTFEISKGTKNILDGMQQHGVQRLIISTGAGVGAPQDSPKLFNILMNFLLKLLSRYVYEDMRKTVEIVSDSALEWTIVRVPLLTDGPEQGRIQVGWVGKGMGPRLNRADLASFMLDQLDSKCYLHLAPAVSN